jgi:hypothetical protein
MSYFIIGGANVMVGQLSYFITGGTNVGGTYVGGTKVAPPLFAVSSKVSYFLKFKPFIQNLKPLIAF